MCVVGFVIPVVFVKATQVQTIGSAKHRFRNTVYLGLERSYITHTHTLSKLFSEV